MRARGNDHLRRSSAKVSEVVGISAWPAHVSLSVCTPQQHTGEPSDERILVVHWIRFVEEERGRFVEEPDALSFKSRDRSTQRWQ